MSKLLECPVRPHQICYLRPVANEIDAIAAISFLNDVAVINDLKNELPRYLEKAWWMNNAHQPTYQTGLFSSVLTQSSQFSHFLFFVNSSSITFFFHRLLHPYYYRIVINRELGPCIRLARLKFELTNQHSADGKNFGVLTSL